MAGPTSRWRARRWSASDGRFQRVARPGLGGKLGGLGCVSQAEDIAPGQGRTIRVRHQALSQT